MLDRNESECAAMSKTNASSVAHYTLKYARDRGIEITNLKLQKLLFFCYGWYLATKGEKLFDDPFEAWPKGPAVYDTWSEFRSFGKFPIAIPLMGMPVEADLAELDTPLSLYAPIDQWTLVRMSHGLSWTAARRGIPPDAHSRERLADDVVMAEFRQIVADFSAMDDDPEDFPDEESGVNMQKVAYTLVPVSIDGKDSALAISGSDMELIGKRIAESEAGEQRRFDSSELRKRLGLSSAGRA
jgi:uncharacterized phage-associated protein